jgi:hypothetical protein
MLNSQANDSVLSPSEENHVKLKLTPELVDILNMNIKYMMILEFLSFNILN